MVSSCSMRSCRVLVSRNFFVRKETFLELSVINIDPEKNSGRAIISKLTISIFHYYCSACTASSSSVKKQTTGLFTIFWKEKRKRRDLRVYLCEQRNPGEEKITHDSSWKCSFVETNTAFIMKYTVDAQQKDEINFSSRFDDLLFVQSAVCCRWKLSPCYYNSFLLLSASI